MAQNQGNIYNVQAHVFSHRVYLDMTPAQITTIDSTSRPEQLPVILAHRSRRDRQPVHDLRTLYVCTEHVRTSSAPCRQSISGRDGSSAQDICKAFQNQTNRVPRRITYYAHPNATDRSIKDRAPRSYSVGRLLLSRKKKKKKGNEKR